MSGADSSFDTGADPSFDTGADSSFDIDGDSLMQSANSPPKPSTPNAQIRSIAISDLSPPDSQGVPLPPAETMPAVAPSASGANMNGKRPISSIDHSQELHGGVSLSAAIPTDAQVKANAATTYQWTQAEDAPGHAWKNKKAQDDCSRAWDTLVDKDRSIGNKYGDPYAMADRELAHMNSRQQ